MAPWLPASMGTLHSSSARAQPRRSTPSTTCPWVPPARLQLEPQLVGATAALNVVGGEGSGLDGGKVASAGLALSCRHSSCGREVQ